MIDRNGILRHMSVNDLPVGRSVDETLRLVKAFQFADKHGEGMFMFCCCLTVLFFMDKLVVESPGGKQSPMETRNTRQ